MRFLATCILALCTFPAWAVEKSATLTNTSTVVSQCSINTLNNIQFGSLDVLGANATVGATGNGSVRVQCTKGSYALTVNNGGSWKARLLRAYACTGCQGSGYVTRLFSCDRYMTSPNGSVLGYVVYKDPDRQTDGTNTSSYTYDSDAGTQCKSSGATFSRLVFDDATRSTDVAFYAQTTSGADNTKVTPGVYTDTLSVQVNF